MKRLDNPFLSTSSLIHYFAHYIKDGNIPPGYKKQTNLKELKNSLKKMYFPGENTNDELTLLESSTRFKLNPLLKNTLQIIFSLPDDANLDDIANANERLSNLPTQEEADSVDSFKRINKLRGYFEGNAEQIALFLELVQICLTVNLCIEETHPYENSQIIVLESAQQIAYKLMWLFIDTPQGVISIEDIANRAHALFNSKHIDKKIDKPFAMLMRINLPRHNYDHIGWVNFISETGLDGLNFLPKATEMSVLNQYKAPRNLQEAHQLYMRVTYTRSQEDTALAELCYEYHLDADKFNTTLEFVQLKWPAKDHDELPNVIITGNEQDNTQGLTWSKIDYSDKRTLIIGHILGNCMHLNGHGKECVKSMATLPTNGLYILNDANGKILAGAYAWRSKSGNLCLDSIDCLPGGIKKGPLEAILTRFAHEVLNTHPEIKYVNVGMGGKTPHFSFTSAIVNEAIEQGCFYGDAKAQYCVATQPSSLSNEQAYALDQILSSYSKQSFCNRIRYLISYCSSSNELIPKLAQILKDDPSLEQTLTKDQLQRLFSFGHKPTLSDLEPINFDFLKLPFKQQSAVLSTVSVPRMLWRMTEAFEKKELESNQALIHFYCAMVKNLPTAQYRIEALETKMDSDGFTMLHHALQFPEMVQKMVNLYTEKQLNTLLRAAEDVCPSLYHAAVPYPKSLSLLLAHDTSPITVKDLNQPHGACKDLLYAAADYPESLTAILQKIPIPERHSAIVSQLDAIINEPDPSQGTEWKKIALKLHTLLHAIPKESRLETIIELLRKTIYGEKDYLIEKIIVLLQASTLAEYPAIFALLRKHHSWIKCCDLTPLKEWLSSKLRGISGTSTSIQDLTDQIEAAQHLNDIAKLITPATWKPQTTVEWLKRQVLGVRNTEKKKPSGSGPSI